MSKIELIPEGAKTAFDVFKPNAVDTPVHYYVFEGADKERYMMYGAGWTDEESRSAKPIILANLKERYDLNATEAEVEGSINTFAPTHRAKHHSLLILIQTGDEYFYLKKVS